MTEAPAPQQSKTDYSACLVWIVENLTFALGMFLMFSKTVDLMTAFAPSTLFGYPGLETVYGLAVGILIEGALFIMKLTLPRAKNVIDWLWNVLVVVAPFIVSALAQVFDSFQVRDTLATQPLWIQTFVTWFVPSIPTIIMALLIGKSIFASMPSEIMPTMVPASEPRASVQKPAGGRSPFRGRFVFKMPGWLRKEKPPANPTPAATEKPRTPR